MTREQYEEAYGSSPVMNVSSIDNRPAPVQMTQAEYNAKYRPKTASFGEDASQDIQETRAAQQSALQTGIDRRSDIEARVASGETSRLKGAFQKFGTGLGTASNVLFETVIGGAKAGLPQSAEDKTKTFFGEYSAAMGERVKSDFQELKNSDLATDQSIVTFVEDVQTAFENDSEFKSDVQAAGGVLEWLSLPSAASKGATATAGLASEGVAKINVAPLVKSVTQPKDVKIEAGRVKDLAALEEKTASLRKLNKFSSDGGEASRSRIARSNVLEGVADSDGVIRTKGTGGAVDAYRKATIEGVEDVVKRNLEREGKAISIPEITSAIKQNIVGSGLEGGDLITALRGVEREMQGLALRMDELGQVPLARIQDAKVNTTRNINFNTPPETKTYRKAVAKAYKEVIEKKSDFNVKEVNGELAKFYKDLERLEALDGKRVKGGRLGKYFAQVSGNIVGGAAGSAVGGPIGTALGTIAGGEAAGFIAGRNMAKSFGKGGVLPEKNAVLAAARAEAGLPPGRSLEVADPIIGIPASTKTRIDKTATPAQKKELATVRKQMADNVKQQRVAVKAKDFTLVAALKDVYDSLVVKMKDLVTEIVESAKNPSVGLAIKSTVTPELVAKKMDFEDLQDVTLFLEDQQAALLNDKLMRLVEEIGISKADLDTQTKFLIEVTDEAERLGLLQSNNLGKRNTNQNPTNTISNTDIDPSVSQAKSATTGTTDLATEAKKYDSAEEFYERMGQKNLSALREQGVRGQEQVTKWWEENTGIKRGDTYGMSHRPSESGSGFDITDSEAMPKDFYDNPQQYIFGNEEASQESIRAILKIHNKPDADVVVYRATPKNELNDGDWISLSKKYAEGESLDEGVDVFDFKVKAKDIQFAGDDINEFGYFPKD